MIVFNGKDDILFLEKITVTLALCPRRCTKPKIPKFLEQKGEDALYTLVF